MITSTASGTSAAFYLSTGDVAARLGYSDETVRRKIASKELDAQRYGNGHYRISKAALAAFRAKRTAGVIRRKPK
jgi:excisionase family DNA binding protein